MHERDNLRTMSTPSANNPSAARIEEASMNAWPATHQTLVDGWLIRISNGFTKRANCVVPLYLAPDTDTDLRNKVRYCENLYAREQLQTIFRITAAISPLPEEPQDNPLDDLLAQRGYEHVDPTRVQIANLQNLPETHSAPGATTNQFQLVTAPEWLRAYSALTEMPPTAAELHANLIRSIRPDCAFAVLSVDDTPVACALGVLEHNLMGLFDVITAQSRRGQGLAQALLTQLLHWGASKGAEHAYLQVIAANAAALSLYRRLGFADLYHYWYRQKG